MAVYKPTIRIAPFIALWCALTCNSALAQIPDSPSATSQHTDAPPAAAPVDKPLPDVVTLMRDVENNQRKSEAVQKDYIFHSVTTADEFDGSGRTKKTTVTESDHFWINGVPVYRTTRKDGKDLSPDEIAKENERLDKSAAKARERREKADQEGKETSPRGDDEITVSRLIELGAFTNARRVQLGGRDTIAVDFTGDPKAKTRNRAEGIVRDLMGTAWIDENDHVLVKVEGHFVDAFKVGGGLLVNVKKDTRFAMRQTKINDEVWLPAAFEGNGAARVLLFFNFNGSVRVLCSDYRKFRTTSTILPAASAAPDQTKTPEVGKP
jgi:hypothetical protein